jgi:hypothetical protein
MRGEELDVIGNRPLHPLSFDGQMAETSPRKLRALPGDRSKIGCRRKQLLRDRLAPYVDQPKPGFILTRWERGAVSDPVLLGGPKHAVPVKARAPIIRQLVGKPPCIFAHGPDAGVLGGFGRRRRELWLSLAPHLPWRESAIAEGSHPGRGLLIAHGARRPREGGKLNDVAHGSSPSMRYGVGGQAGESGTRLGAIGRVVLGDDHRRDLGRFRAGN